MSRSPRLIGTLTFMGMALVAVTQAQAQAGGPYQFNSLNPCRQLDTRCPNNAASCLATQMTNPAKVNPGPYGFRMQGSCGVPLGAKAVTLNVTVVGPSHAGNLSIYPSNLSSAAGSAVSTINFAAGEPALANGAIVPLAPTASGFDVAVYLNMAVVAPGGSSHFIVDVTGYFQ
jgi:hypothetical protein